MMCRAKCAVITVQANIMVYLRVTDVLAFLNVRYVDHGIMYAKQKPKDNVLLIKRIEISAEHAV